MTFDRNDKEENLFTVMFLVTRTDVLTWAKEMGVPLESINEDMIKMLKQKIREGTDAWREMFEDMIKEAIRCPLNMACSKDCPYQEIGGCLMPSALEND